MYLSELLPLALMCRDAYKDEHDDTTLVLENESEYAILREHDGCQYVAVRGSDDVKDWLSNVAIRQVECAETKQICHRGFDNGAHRILTALIELNGGARALDPGLPIVFTGHSRGASISHRLADILVSNWWPVYYSCGIASPRHLKLGSEPVARYVNVGITLDVVPRVPTRQMGYWHRGEWHFFAPTRDSFIYFYGEDARRRLILEQAHVPTAVALERAKDERDPSWKWHSIDVYCRAIEACL